jgi:osmotically-inducible protein OsmY
MTPERSTRRAFWRGFVAGGLVALVFDPTVDHSPRTLAIRSLRRRARRLGRRFGRVARHAWSESSGIEQRLLHPHAGEAADDLTLLDRIQSEIYRRPEIPKGTFNVEVVRGVTVLRGQVPDRAAIATVEQAVREVDGVAGVWNLLHVAGEPAPNKRAALEALTA